jgi:hypothetical protein
MSQTAWIGEEDGIEFFANVVEEEPDPDEEFEERREEEELEEN